MEDLVLKIAKEMELNEYRTEITANYAAMLESVENAVKTPYAVTRSAGK